MLILYTPSAGLLWCSQRHEYSENIWKGGLPQEKKTGNMYSSSDTQRAHAPVEMSKPAENETNYRAKQNNMKTDQRHPHTKKNSNLPNLGLGLLREVYHSSHFGGGVKNATPLWQLCICGAPCVGKNVVFKAGSWLKMSVFKAGRLY